MTNELLKKDIPVLKKDATIMLNVCDDICIETCTTFDNNVTENKVSYFSLPDELLLSYSQENVMYCEICNYECSKNKHYNSHMLTNKHKKNVLKQKNKLNFKNMIDLDMIFLCKCGKKYKYKQGLWNHKQKCTKNCENVEQTPIITNDTEKTTTEKKVDSNIIEAFITLMKQNQEFKELMIEQSQEQHKQNREFQKQMLDISKECKIINNNNTTNNSFNLNVYLNETCKDAVNMVDFVNSLHLELSDLEETGKLGYSGGMSRIFINGLKDMEVHKRPIHCSDLKREILYIKEDNVWEKDNENRDGIKNALRKIEQKNIQQIPLWIKAHPNCVISSNKENTPYLKMVMQSTGGTNPDETANMSKIITNIAKAVVINK